MKFGQSLLVIVLSVLVAAGTAYYMNSALNSGNFVQNSKKETRLEQIKRTGVLRCGYTDEPPFITKDPNTGQMGGMGYDLVEEIGRQLNVKIVWAGEVAPGQMLTDLAVNRYDMICKPFLATPGRTREANFTIPLFYYPIYLYGRANDTRFDNNYARANAPDVRFAVLDGDYSSLGAYKDFPKAAKVALPQIASIPELYVLIADNKADLVVADPLTFDGYSKGNPGALRQVKGKPLLVSAVGFPLPAKEQDLKNAIDATLAYLQGIGYLDSLLKKYESPNVRFLYLIKPYADGKDAAP